MLLPSCFLLSCLLAPPPGTPNDSLVAAELAFAHRAEAVGYPQAFVETFAEDVVTFHPHPMKGRALYAKGPRDQGRLRWYASWAKLSADGSAGFISGPWQYLPAGGGPPVGTGHFASVWRRGPKGWEVILDAGAAHPTPTLELPAMGAAETPRGPKPAQPPADLDAAFTRQSSAAGVAAAYAAVAGELRFLRAGETPGRSLGARQGDFAALKGHAWKVQASGTPSPDLAFTYGTRCSPEGRAEAVYVRFWRADAGRWKLDLDLELPLQAEGKAD